MKINVEKISKLQAGGFLTYRPLTRPPEAMTAPEEPTAAATKAAAKKDDDLDDSMKKLLGNGITNDVMQYSDQIQQVETQYQSLTDSEKEGPKGRHLRSVLKGNFGELNGLLRAKEIFDKSVAKASAAGGLEEYAVVPGAFVVKKSDGTLDKVSFGQFAKDKNSGDLTYKPLTNSELARERELNKNLVGNNSIFSIIEYSKGMEQIQKEVLGIATGIGKTSTSSTTGAYDEGTVEAMKEAQLKAGQGIFKVKESVSDSSNSEQIKRAKQVMWSMLGDNSKNILRARAAFLENDPSKVEERAALLAMDLLDPRLDTTHSSTSDMAYTKGAKGSGGSGGAGAQLGDLGEREAAVQGLTQVEHMSLLSDYGVQIDSRMYVLPKDDVTKKDKEGNIKPTTVNASNLGNYGYIGKATTLNGEKIDPSNTIFTGEAYYTRIPVIRTGNGLILDEAGAAKMAAVEAEYRALPASQQKTQMKEVLMKKHGANRLDIQEVILAEAASYEDKYTLWGLRGKRDAKFYKDADDQTTQLLGEAVDPEEKGIRNGVDYKAYKHMIIIPSKGEAKARYTDKNNLLAPKAGWDATNPLRGVQSSSRSFGGSAFSTPNPNFSQSTLDN